MRKRDTILQNNLDMSIHKLSTFSAQIDKLKKNSKPKETPNFSPYLTKKAKNEILNS